MTYQNRVSFLRIGLVLCCSWPVSACTELQVSAPTVDGGASGGTVVESGGDGPTGGAVVDTGGNWVTGGTVVDTGGNGATGGTGATGGAQVTGGTVAETGGDSTTACAAEGALRCSASSPVNREVCGGGEWLASTACAADEVCDGVDAACLSLDSFCMGNTGQHVCAGTVMHLCSDRGLSVSQLDCGDARLCQDGLSRGECALCLAEEDFTCDAASLSECRADGSGFEWSETCATAALCNPLVGGCTAAACTAGSHVCEGDLLRGCNDTQTGFEDVRTCLADLCDGVAGSCDVCVRGEKACRGAEPATCNQEGSDWIPGSCPAAEPLCTGQGSCVQCRTVTDCTGAAEVCRAKYCDSASGQCGSTITADASCTQGSGSSGFCSGAGDCVQCRTASDCGSFEACNAGSCERVPRCGDGFIDSGEQCDDGDVFDDNQCSSQCKSNDYGVCDPEAGNGCYGGAGLCSSLNGTAGGSSQCLPGCVPTGAACPNLPGATAGGQRWSTVCIVQGCFVLAGSPVACPPEFHAGVFTSGSQTETICILD